MDLCGCVYMLVCNSASWSMGVDCMEQWGEVKTFVLVTATEKTNKQKKLLLMLCCVSMLLSCKCTETLILRLLHLNCRLLWLMK